MAIRKPKTTSHSEFVKLLKTIMNKIDNKEDLTVESLSETLNDEELADEALSFLSVLLKGFLSLPSDEQKALMTAGVKNMLSSKSGGSDLASSFDKLLTALQNNPEIAELLQKEIQEGRVHDMETFKTFFETLPEEMQEVFAKAISVAEDEQTPLEAGWKEKLIEEYRDIVERDVVSMFVDNTEEERAIIREEVGIKTEKPKAKKENKTKEETKIKETEEV